jgi:hypothetical protein
MKKFYLVFIILLIANLSCTFNKPEKQNDKDKIVENCIPFDTLRKQLPKFAIHLDSLNTFIENHNWESFISHCDTILHQDSEKVEYENAVLNFLKLETYGKELQLYEINTSQIEFYSSFDGDRERDYIFNGVIVDKAGEEYSFQMQILVTEYEWKIVEM